MPTNESEIELLARAMIDRHGLEAARAAVVRLNQMIDRGDWSGRDRWACVVREIHEQQGRRFPPNEDRVERPTTHLV